MKRANVGRYCLKCTSTSVNATLYPLYNSYLQVYVCTDKKIAQSTTLSRVVNYNGTVFVTLTTAFVLFVCH